ncbi:MAG: porin family protein [Pseudomonadota bacterium]|mgnify:CR=1 FL=1|nr:porin family protein [Pseudomonadota bacterium]MEC8665555.1 porin family protein [Pseudomonadota bacterium]
MRHIVLALSLLLVTVLIALPVSAQSSRLYFAGYLGLNTSNDQEFSESTTGRSGDFERDNGTSFAGALGLRLNHQWRVEAEVSYRQTDFDGVTINNNGTFKSAGDLSTLLYMMNVYYDIDYEWRNFSPFLTAGLGLASHSAQIEDLSGFLPDASSDSFGLAYSLGGGLKYRLSDSAALTTNYRYVGTTDFDVDGYTMDYNTHEFRLGLEYDIPFDLFK